MATKKKTKTAKAPKRVWFCLDGSGDMGSPFRTRKAAQASAITDAFDPIYNDRVVGPYVLAPNGVT